MPLSMMRSTTLLAGLLYLLLALYALGANPLRGQTVAPMDLLLSQPGWSSVAPAPEVRHPERSDVLDASLPTWRAIKRDLRAGGDGTWLAARSGGMPGLQNLSNGLLTPGFLAFLLVEEDWLGYYLAGLLKLLLAGLGMFLFLRRFLDGPASLLGGAIYMLVGFHAAWFFWKQVDTSLWIPWLLWATAGWLATREPRWLIGICLSAALLITGGFPSVAAYGFYIFALLALVWLAAERAPPIRILRSGLGAGVAVILAFLLTAIPLLGLAEFLGQFDFSWRRGASPFVFPDHLPLFLDPEHLGMPRVELTLYAGIVALLLALAAPVFLFRGHREQRLLVVFALSTLLVSFLVAFDLLPGEWLRQVPALGSNNRGRLVILIGLALAMLAAAGLQVLISKAWRLKHRHGRFAAFTLLGLLCLVQVQDQVRLFQRFNAVVPKEWFFPPTPTLARVREDLGPLEGVIADRAYLVSGTLVAYGLPEWFAHTFKTPAEQEALEQLVQDPFVTPTAASFAGERIRFEEPLMNAFGIRYVLMADRFSGQVPFQVRDGGDHRPAPPLPEHRLEQRFRLEAGATLSGISLWLATYRAPEAPADAVLTLRDGRGDTLARARVPRGEIRDNREVLFDFPQPLPLPAGDYAFELQLAEPAPGRLTAWTTSGQPGPEQNLWSDGRDSGRSLRYRLLTPRDLPWRAERLEPGLVLLENPAAPHGPYRVADLATDPAEIHRGDLEILEANGSAYRIRYRGTAPGYVVLPMRHYPGWRARVDGEARALERYLDLFPAVWMDGPGTLALDYRPTSLRLGLPLTLAGAAGLLVLSGLALRQRRRRA